MNVFMQEAENKELEGRLVAMEARVRSGALAGPASKTAGTSAAGAGAAAGGAADASNGALLNLVRLLEVSEHV